MVANNKKHSFSLSAHLLLFYVKDEAPHRSRGYIDKQAFDNLVDREAITFTFIPNLSYYLISIFSIYSFIILSLPRKGGKRLLIFRHNRTGLPPKYLIRQETAHHPFLLRDYF